MTKELLHQEQKGNVRIVRAATVGALVFLVCTVLCGIFARLLVIPCLVVGTVCVLVVRMYVGRYEDVRAQLRS